MNKTSFLFVLNEVFEEVGGNAEGRVSHGVFLQFSDKKLEMKYRKADAVFEIGSSNVFLTHSKVCLSLVLH